MENSAEKNKNIPVLPELYFNTSSDHLIFIKYLGK